MNEDLISRSAAKDEILSWAVIINKPHLLSKEDTLHVLDTLPAVDVEKVCEQMGLVKEAMDMAKAYLRPVRHGRWYWKPIDERTSECTCSVCGQGGCDDFNYCPHCGAKMDGGINDGTDYER